MCGVYEYVYVGVCTHTCVQRPDEKVTFPVLLPRYYPQLQTGSAAEPGTSLAVSKP